MRGRLLLAVAVLAGAVCAETLPLARFAFGPEPAQTFDIKAARAYYGGFTLDGNEIVCTVGTNTGAGATWSLPLQQKVAAPLVLETDGLVVAGGGRGEIALYCDLAFQDGTSRSGYRVTLRQDPALGWQHKELVLDVGRPIRRAFVIVYARYDGRLKARFRAPTWRVKKPIQESVMPVDSTAAVCGPLPEGSGFLVRDVAAGSGWDWIGAAGGAAKGIELAVRTQTRAGATFYDVTARRTAGGDRALTIAFVERLPAGRLTGFLTPTLSHAAGPQSGEFSDFATSGVGCGGLSKWPLVAATADKVGRALALDASAPVYNRLLFNAHLRSLLLAADVGLTDEKPTAHYRFATFPFAAEGGFRGAYDAYMKAFPEFFEVRVPRQGMWMAFRPTSRIRGVEDFDFAYKEGEGEVDWDDAHGLLTFHYTEPVTWWMDIRGVPRGKATMADAYQELTNRLAKGEVRAKAWMTSVMHDEDGRPVGSLCSVPWCENGCLWSMSSLPGLKGEVTDYSSKLGSAEVAKRFSRPYPQGVDGEYLDSAEMEPVSLDYNRAHFAAAECPLAFSAHGSRRVGIYTGLVWSEYTRRIAADVRAHGRFMMANCTPHRYVWIASYMDVLGTESIWITGPSKKWTPPGNEWFLYKRFAAGAKPSCFLLQEDFDRFDRGCMEKAMHRMLAWGFFPGFSQPPDKNVIRYPETYYWLNRKYYDRDRDLFKRFLPLVREIAEAGWRPLNALASVSDRSLVCEQFGARYVTVFNPSPDKPATFTLRSLAGRTSVRERLSGGTLDLPGAGATVTLPSERALLLDFGDAR